MTLAEKILAGDVKAAARLISLIEDGSPEALGAVDTLSGYAGRAWIIGITGAPGSGKSTLADGLIGHWREEGKTLGVIAIDPSSQRTGGAVLGDRIRMQRHAADPGVFIRSLATRGFAGGLALAAAGASRVLDTLGRDIVLVETVGAGQVEIDIAGIADTTLVVLSPGSGDSVQALKAGILEIADIFVINKADREGADRLRAELEAMLAMPEFPADWIPPIVLTEAVSEKGIEKLAGEIRRHRGFLETGDHLALKRRERTRMELVETVRALFNASLEKLDLTGILDRIQLGDISPRQAAADIVRRLAETGD